MVKKFIKVLSLIICIVLIVSISFAKDEKANEIIVDNADKEGFKTKGGWESDYGEGGENHGSDAMWAYINEKAEDTATWTPDLKKTGKYEVYIWYCADPNDDHAEKAPFYVYDGKKKKEFIINLKENYGKWNKLGEFKLPKGKKAYVMATSCADGNVIADAVKFVYKK